jgi:deoxyribodipyrimidine photo-lyase
MRDTMRHTFHMNPKLTYEEILALIDTFDPIAYAKTRNHLNGGVSRLSPYITRGVISLPAIHARLLERYQAHEIEKFIQELAWREYFQKVFAAKGREIFSELRFPRTNWNHHEVVSAISSATTGIEAVDIQISELIEKAYMHNHARMWTAMLTCNVANAHWFPMSRWMYYHLLDGDLASNTLSWQWVAGTSVQKQYLANQTLINGCSNTKQKGTYLDVPIEELVTIPLPEKLEAHEPYSYTMVYPESEMIGNVAHKTVLLYHPWSIDPLWRKDVAGERIFIIEPRLFDEFPVSPKVVGHMLDLVKTHVPEARVYVGNVETIPGIEEATVFSKSHPTTTHFPGVKDQVEELFPQVKGYHQSFFKFWQACQATR